MFFTAGASTPDKPDRKLHRVIIAVFCICRELAHQIAEQFRVLGKPIGLRDLVITGGRGVLFVFPYMCSLIPALLFDFTRNFVVITAYCTVVVLWKCIWLFLTSRASIGSF